MRLLIVIISIWMLEYSSASDLECSYSYDSYGVYNCMTMNFQLKNENALIESVKGQHLPGKTQVDVNGLMIIFSKNKFLSLDIFEKFPNLKELSVWHYSVEKIVQGNFDGAQHLYRIFFTNNIISELTDNIFSGAFNLVSVVMKMNRIRSISNQTFAGLTNLKTINLDHNYLESLPRGVFDDLINLKNVSLTGNILKRLDGDLFKNNLKIENLWFSSNYLSVIGSNLITQLRSLKTAIFYDNLCISAGFLNSVNINVLNDKIAECTESNKPEQKLFIAESEKKKADAKTDLVSKDNEDLRKINTEIVQENRSLKQSVEVSHQEISNFNQNNRELNKSSMKQLQEIGALKQNIEALDRTVNTFIINNTALRKTVLKLNSDVESNQQISTKVNEELNSCENKLQRSKFGFKCFHQN